jgi:pimeloyl-ACP methyl ester carboxylesterase
MNTVARRSLWLARWFPALGWWALRRQEQLFRRDPEALLDWFINRLSRPDRELFARPEVRAMFRGDLEEVLVRGQGAAGLVRELRLYFRWGFRLEDLPPDRKVLLWHGDDDPLVPPPMMAAMARRLPNAQAHRAPGGHFMVLDILDEVMSRARDELGNQGLG